MAITAAVGVDELGFDFKWRNYNRVLKAHTCNPVLVSFAQLDIILPA